MQTSHVISSLVSASILMGLVSCAASGPTSESPSPGATPEIPAATTQAPTLTQGPVDMRWFSFFGGSAQGVWDIHAKLAFEAANPGVSVTYGSAGLYGAPVPADPLDRQLNLDRPPDVITGFIGGASLTRYIHDGKIAPLNDVWDSENLAGAYPASVEDLAKVDASPYFVPLAVQWNPVFYRADIFNRLGLHPPDTWDSFLQTCRTLNDAGIIPITDSTEAWTPPNARWFSTLDLRLNGADFHQRLLAGEISFEDPRVRDVFEHWLQMLTAGCFGPADRAGGWSQAVNQISSGEAAMFNIGEWLYEFISPDVQQDIDFFRFPMINPGVDDGEIALVYGAYIPRNAVHPKAGRAFIHYLLSQEGLKMNVDEVGRLIPIDRLAREDFPAYQQQGWAFLDSTPQLVELFEFNAFRGSMATQGLAELATFWKARDEAAIDDAMAGLESARQAALSEGSN